MAEEETEGHGELLPSVVSTKPLNIMANDEQLSSATSPEQRTIPVSTELWAGETSEEVRSSGLSVESWNGEENAELQTSEKSAKAQTSEMSSEPQTSEKSKEPQISEESAKLQTTGNSVNPQIIEENSELQTSEKNPEPQASEASKEQQTSEKSKEPQTSEESAEPQTNETSAEPQTSETNAEPQTSEKSKEPRISEENAEPQTSEKNKGPRISEVNAKPRMNEKSVKPWTSEKNQGIQLGDKSMEPQTKEKGMKPQTGGKSAKPRTKEKSAKSRTMEKSGEPWSSEKREELWSNENREEPWPSEKSEEPWISEKSEEPRSIEKSKEPWLSEKSEEPWSSEKSEGPWTSEKRVESWPSTMEPETEASGVFTTAVTEEKLQEAREKSEKRVFGSSQVFWQVEDRKDQSNVYSFPHIVQSRAKEHYETGLTLLFQGDTEEAVIAFSKAINLQPDQIELYLKRAEAFLHLCDFQSAALNLRKACSAASPTEEHLSLLAFTLYLQGESLFDREIYLGALESFTCASELQPWKPMYHLRSIACLAALGRNADCLRLVNKLLEEERANPDLYVLRARLHYKFNKVLLCYQDVGEALRLESDHTAAQTLRRDLKNQADEAKALAVIKAVEGQLLEALSKICSAIEHDPADANYYTLRGTLYRRLQDFSSAMDDFVLAMQLSGAAEVPPVLTQVVETPPELPGTSLGHLLITGTGESHLGVSTNGPATGERLSVFLEAQKQLLLTYSDFAVHCYNKGFYEEGVLLLNKAIKGQKQEMGLYMNRGDCLFQLGELSLALADYQQALDLSPLDSGVRHRLAMLQNELGLQEQQQRRFQEAESHFSRAIEKQPRLATYYLHRAQVRRSLQDGTGAQEDALTALLLDPSSSEAEPLVMGFFPGKSLVEILSSKQCAVAKERLERHLQACPSSKLQDNSKRGKQQGMCSGAEDALDGSTGACSDVAQCVTDGVVYAEMVQGRKRINQEIQRVLQTKGEGMSSAPRKPAQTLKGAMPHEAQYHWVTGGLTSAPN